MTGCGGICPRAEPASCLRREIVCVQPRVFADSRLFFHDCVSAPSPAAIRLDKWLWAVRVFKTRSLATDACRAGSVQVGGRPAKPARDVRIGETVTVRQGLAQRTLVVRGVPERRVGARLVADFCDDRTPPEERAKADVAGIEQFLARERGSGRPTKRDRRLLDRLLR